MNWIDNIVLFVSCIIEIYLLFDFFFAFFY